jgi:hypothetical protein
MAAGTSLKSDSVLIPSFLKTKGTVLKPPLFYFYFAPPPLPPPPEFS